MSITNNCSDCIYPSDLLVHKNEVNQMSLQIMAECTAGRERDIVEVLRNITKRGGGCETDDQRGTGY